MMNSKRRKEIERKANEFRSTLGIFSDGISNVFDICNNKYYLIRYPLGTDSVLGAVIYRDDDYIVFSNSSSVLSREIFTVAHEIGHIVLEHVGPVKQMLHDVGFEEATDYEEEANYFAACFLMPEDKVKNFIEYQFQNHNQDSWSLLEIAAIMSTFSVSFDMVTKRLVELDYISPEQRNALMCSKNETKVSKILRAIGVSPDLCYPKEIKSIPVEFLQWVRNNYVHGVIPIETLKKATDYLDMSVDDFDVEAPQIEEDFDLDAFLEGDDE